MLHLLNSVCSSVGKIIQFSACLSSRFKWWPWSIKKSRKNFTTELENSKTELRATVALLCTISIKNQALWFSQLFSSCHLSFHCLLLLLDSFVRKFEQFLRVKPCPVDSGQCPPSTPPPWSTTSSELFSFWTFLIFWLRCQSRWKRKDAGAKWAKCRVSQKRSACSSALSYMHCCVGKILIFAKGWIICTKKFESM